VFGECFSSPEVADILGHDVFGHEDTQVYPLDVLERLYRVVIDSRLGDSRFWGEEAGNCAVQYIPIEVAT
jgi:hypothetical protein